MSKKTKKSESSEKGAVIAKQETSFKDTLATTSERILSAIIDTLIIDAMFLLAFLVPLILRTVWVFYGYPILIILIQVSWGVLIPLASIGMLLYLILFPTFKGYTPGQKTLKIKPMIIENLEKELIRPFEKKDIKVIIKRVLFGSIDSILFGLVGIYLMSHHSLHQAFCDRQTNVVVLQVEEEKEEIEPLKTEVPKEQEVEVKKENLKEEKTARKKTKKEKKNE